MMERFESATAAAPEIAVAGIVMTVDAAVGLDFETAAVVAAAGMALRGLRARREVAAFAFPA